MRAYPRRLVDGNLLLNGQVHHQVQEWIGRTLFRQVILLLMLLRIFQHRKIFGMLANELRHQVFERREQFLGAVFSPGLEQEVARFVS